MSVSDDDVKTALGRVKDVLDSRDRENAEYNRQQQQKLAQLHEAHMRLVNNWQADLSAAVSEIDPLLHGNGFVCKIESPLANAHGQFGRAPIGASQTIPGQPAIAVRLVLNRQSFQKLEFAVDDTKMQIKATMKSRMAGQPDDVIGLVPLAYPPARADLVSILKEYIIRCTSHIGAANSTF